MSGMTKQHFETIARGIRLTPGLTPIQRKIQAESMASQLAGTNRELTSPTRVHRAATLPLKSSVAALLRSSAREDRPTCTPPPAAIQQRPLRATLTASTPDPSLGHQPLCHSVTAWHSAARVAASRGMGRGRGRGRGRRHR
jgi:hypothetical protein